MIDSLRVGLLVEPASELRLQPRGLAAVLKRAGAQLRIIDAHSTVHWLDADRLIAQCDVVVARANTREVLGLLGLAEARGLITINRRAAMAAMHNKADMVGKLAAAGIPTVPAFIGLSGTLARACSEAQAFPVLVRYMFGDAGARACVVWTADEMAASKVPQPWLAQSVVEGARHVLKLYGIGSQVWSVRNEARFGDTQPGPPHPILRLPPQSATRAQRNLAHRCRDLFGLDTYAITCIETPEGPLVLDIDDITDYAGIEGAAELLASMILRRSGRGREPLRANARFGLGPTA
jgi:glutathione synthase/RimK-type ligase-like ATP-grasp enzyme